MKSVSKIVPGVVISFACISILHLWLNIGFDNLGLTGGNNSKNIFKVGFLPVT